MERKMLYFYHFLWTTTFLTASLMGGVMTDFQVDDQLYVYDADEELEKVESSCLERVFAQFKAKGGLLHRLSAAAKPFALQPGDAVFPSCSGGHNRSQTLWNVLRVYSEAIILHAPHATRYGFDPYDGQPNWQYRDIRSNDEFFLWAGVAKCPQLGFEQFSSWVPDARIDHALLSHLKSYYDSNYYNPPLAAGTRRVYITFARNVHVHLQRLAETNASLENVIVLFFPLGDLIYDPLPAWNTYPSSTEAYEALALLLKAQLNFEQLLEPVEK